MGRGTWRAAVAGLLAGALLLPVTPAAADDPNARRRAVEAQLAEVHDDLHESSAAVREAAAALAKADAELPRVRARLAAVQGQLSAARAAAAEARRALGHAQADLLAGERQLGEAQAQVEETRARAGALARSIYKTGPGGFVAVLFNAQSAADLASRTTYVHALLSDGAGQVREATVARVELANKADVLAQRRAAIAAKERDASAALARVEQLAAEARAANAAVAAQVEARRRALAVADRERAADVARYKALQAESRRLAELIRQAARSRGTGRVGRTGMVWPTPGPVTSGYGYRTHPIYGYRRLHAGIDIGAPTGQGIVAALGGTVVTAGPMGSYGNLVVIDHGDGFATAYAHQSRVLVSSGQRVAKGQRIGLVGSTGASTGPHLHFETRVNGEPVDPMRYY
jgi:murein DD-endopeptidase MepM/ murein hydrolase activator NlpD